MRLEATSQLADMYHAKRVQAIARFTENQHIWPMKLAHGQEMTPDSAG
jgi:hypothetical protein